MSDQQPLVDNADKKSCPETAKEYFVTKTHYRTTPWNLWMMCLMIAISAFFALIAFFGKGSIFFIPAAVFCLAVHAIGGVAIYWRNKNALMAYAIVGIGYGLIYTLIGFYLISLINDVSDAVGGATGDGLSKSMGALIFFGCVLPGLLLLLGGIFAARAIRNKDLGKLVDSDVQEQAQDGAYQAASAGAAAAAGASAV